MSDSDSDSDSEQTVNAKELKFSKDILLVTDNPIGREGIVNVIISDPEYTEEAKSVKEYVFAQDILDELDEEEENEKKEKKESDDSDDDSDVSENEENEKNGLFTIYSLKSGKYKCFVDEEYDKVMIVHEQYVNETFDLEDASTSCVDNGKIILCELNKFGSHDQNKPFSEKETFSIPISEDTEYSSWVLEKNGKNVGIYIDY